MSQGYNLIFQTLLTFYEKVLTYKLPQVSPEEIKTMAAEAGTVAIEYAKAHPYMSAFTILQIGLVPVLGTGWLTTSLLKAIGFGPLGPIAGSLASWYQATWLGGYIPAGSIFAVLQKWAMVP